MGRISTRRARRVRKKGDEVWKSGDAACRQCGKRAKENESNQK
jgi:hypothetical protein